MQTIQQHAAMVIAGTNGQRFWRNLEVNKLMGYDIEDLAVGMTAAFSKTITESDIVLFAAVSGDNNAMHINEEFASETVFAGRVAHGMLSASVISAAIANRLPGPGTIYMSQNLRFKAPVRPGDTVHARVTVKEIFLEKQRALLTTECFVKSQLVVEGEALVKVTSSELRGSNELSRSMDPVVGGCKNDELTKAASGQAA